MFQDVAKKGLFQILQILECLREHSEFQILEHFKIWIFLIYLNVLHIIKTMVKSSWESEKRAWIKCVLIWHLVTFFISGYIPAHIVNLPFDFDASSIIRHFEWPNAATAPPEFQVMIKSWRGIWMATRRGEALRQVNFNSPGTSFLGILGRGKR